MKYYRRIYINESGFPSDLYEQIVRLDPESCRQNVFMLEAQPGDEERGRLCEQVAALCEERGLKRTAGDPGTYGYSVTRKYEPDDFANVLHFIVLNVAKMFKDPKDVKKRDANGRITLPATQATAAVTVASIFPRNWVVVSDPVRQLLESNGLIGLRFMGTVLKGSSTKAAKHPFWELKSSVTLPKMVNSVFIEERGNYIIDEPPFSFGEPHYRSTELKDLEPFDVAYAFESGSPDYQDQPLIISRKFHQCCLRNGIELELMPVRVDAD